jgi:hypothetical protein
MTFIEAITKSGDKNARAVNDIKGSCSRGATERRDHSQEDARFAEWQILLGAPFVDEVGNQTGPAGLVAGTQSCAGVTMKIFIKKKVIAPVRIVLEL